MRGMSAALPPEVPEIQVAEIPPGAVLLDVREPVEWSAGHIEGARHIPMNDLPQRLADVPADETVVVVCKSGGRSGQVTGYLNARGHQAVNLAGGMLAWATSGKAMVSETGEAPRVY